MKDEAELFIGKRFVVHRVNFRHRIGHNLVTIHGRPLIVGFQFNGKCVVVIIRLVQCVLDYALFVTGDFVGAYPRNLYGEYRSGYRLSVLVHGNGTEVGGIRENFRRSRSAALLYDENHFIRICRCFSVYLCN